jgi:hypothetical protein
MFTTYHRKQPETTDYAVNMLSTFSHAQDVDVLLAAFPLLLVLGSKGGVETIGFPRTLTVFRCVSLPGGCISNMFVYAGCVFVSLHFSLHVSSWLRLLSRCYMVLLRRCFMNA